MEPRSAADPRPGNRPYYIAEVCSKCCKELVLADRLKNPNVPENRIWYDEWECPKCRDGIYMDSPEIFIGEEFQGGFIDGELGALDD